ncbi:MAG: matrixin family metalloprotease [Thaumarchaeota archaeon]|nr:matrixin family metalloprotease [Nitrososphaerota archaeon]
MKKSGPQGSELDASGAAEIGRIESEIHMLEKNQAQFHSDMKKGRTILVVVLLIAAFSAILSFENEHPFTEKAAKPAPPPDFAIINTKGGKIQTWIAWNIPKSQNFSIYVERSPEVTEDRLKIIHDVIFSDQTVPAKNTIYYKGWAGALTEISSKNTKFAVPDRFITGLTSTNTGDVVINLTDLVNPAGYTGFTRSIVGPNDQILKSEITIYGVGALDDSQFATILRHELGHAFGLAYSDDPNDIMHLTVNQSQPYISSCDVAALESLYNGSMESQVSC